MKRHYKIQCSPRRMALVMAVSVTVVAVLVVMMMMLVVYNVQRLWHEFENYSLTDPRITGTEEFSGIAKHIRL